MYNFSHRVGLTDHDGFLPATVMAQYTCARSQCTSTHLATQDVSSKHYRRPGTVASTTTVPDDTYTVVSSTCNVVPPTRTVLTDTSTDATPTSAVSLATCTVGLPTCAVFAHSCFDYSPPSTAATPTVRTVDVRSCICDSPLCTAVPYSGTVPARTCADDAPVGHIPARPTVTVVSATGSSASSCPLV